MNRGLRRAVVERLAAVEETAVGAGSQPAVRTKHDHLSLITDRWREVLIEHQPDRNGRCPGCSRWLRSRRWPCQVWMTAHEHLIGGGPEPTRWSVRKADPFRHPRRVEVVPRQVCAPAVEQAGARHPGGTEGSSRRL